MERDSPRALMRNVFVTPSGTMQLSTPDAWEWDNVWYEVVDAPTDAIRLRSLGAESEEIEVAREDFVNATRVGEATPRFEGVAAAARHDVPTIGEVNEVTIRCMMSGALHEYVFTLANRDGVIQALPERFVQAGETYLLSTNTDAAPGAVWAVIYDIADEVVEA